MTLPIGPSPRPCRGRGTAGRSPRTTRHVRCCPV